MRFFVFLPLCVSCILVSSLQAQPARHLPDEQAFLADIPQITSATRFTQTLTDAPVSVTVIDRAMISASGAQNLPDLFRLVPGFQVFHVNTNKYGVTYHGMSDDFPNRLEVMIDGRSVYMPLISAPDWTSLGLHLEDIERIEVIRGSNTATHGSNAFMGAINIITRIPAAEPRAALVYTQGSLGTQEGHARLTQLTPHGHYRLSMTHHTNEGSQRYQDSAQRNYLNLAASFTPTLSDQIDLNLGIDRGHKEIGSFKKADSIAVRQDYEADFQHLRWQHYLDTHNKLVISAYRNSLNLKEAAPTVYDFANFLGFTNPNSVQLAYAKSTAELNPGLRFSGENGYTRQQDLQVTYDYDQSNIQHSSGVGIRHDLGRSDTLFQNGHISATRYRAFNNFQMDLTPEWVLNLGALYEKQASAADAKSFRSALNYHASIDTTLRLGYSYSERLPSLAEQYGNASIFLPGPTGPIIYDQISIENPDLKAENIRSLELGITKEFNRIPGYLDLKVFSEKVNDSISSFWIYTDDMEDQRVRNNQNIGNLQNTGSELQLRLQPTDKLWLSLAYSYTRARHEKWATGKINKDGNINYFNRPPHAPRHTFGGLVNWSPLHNLNLSLAHYYMDHVFWQEGDRKRPYNRTDVRLSKQWDLSADQTLEAALTVQNIANKTYQEFYDLHDFERRTFLQLKLKYH
ncbi:TonB-dependent receptor plug domain-containing protein [Nitrincola tapanii]|uniref:TonB-dependent receptor n=1 Tax=Nitrincola tapanii TaxID=1708751 RepID=A0A5A9W220_9GAMM|nr:TonB-dependent receptor plug domain-containing protein [Nitrincola tapanii]KAA0874603.1 TonB-dependent receptor [Nitrincola tapanii]